MQKPLTIKNAYMFAKVLEDPELCRGVIESILGIEIGQIEYQNTEEEMVPFIGAKGVRLDAYVKATGQVFDIEMQAVGKGRLGMRIRFYQSAIDSTLRERGGSYDDLEESFVIFICGYDPYGRGLPVYHIERTCQEDPAIEIGDASHWVVLNSTAWDKDEDEARSMLLQYIQNGETGDALTKRLDSAVSKANEDAEWRKQVMGFMTLEHDMNVQVRCAREEGLAEGEANGEARYSKLIDILLDENRIDDLKRAADDVEYRHSLFTEFDL